MKKAFWISCAVVAAVAVPSLGPQLFADGDVDWGSLVQREMNERSEQLFGVGTPLRSSALGPYTAADSTNAIRVAGGLDVSLVSSAVHASTDMIVLWPNDQHPTHLFVCDEGSSNPAVQRVDLSRPAGSNATTILTGIVACDPIRRTPWGSLIAAEEAPTAVPTKSSTPSASRRPSPSRTARSVRPAIHASSSARHWGSWPLKEPGAARRDHYDRSADAG